MAPRFAKRTQFAVSLPDVRRAQSSLRRAAIGSRFRVNWAGLALTRSTDSAYYYAWSGCWKVRRWIFWRTNYSQVGAGQGKMTINRDRLVRIFDELGQKLAKPTTICVIGSSPGIASGQPDRQSLDIDVWRPRSAYDETEFRRACQELGLQFDPRSELDPAAIYVQIVQPGIVKLPPDFKVEVLGQYGNLTVTMPEPALLSAAKLVRGEPRDIEDVAWWVKERALDLDEIRAAVGSLPDRSQRDAAQENIVLIELFVASERKPK